VGCADEACDSNGSVFFSASSSDKPPFDVERKGSTAAIPARPFKPGADGMLAEAGEGADFGGTEPVLLVFSFLGDDGAVFGLGAEEVAFLAGGVSESISISSGSPDSSSAVA